MKKTLLIMLLIGITVSNANSQVVDWALSLGGINDEETSYWTDTDHNGNLFVGGTFIGKIEIGEFTLESKSPFFRDFYTAKISPQGDVLWAISGGSEKDEQVWVIKVDNNGDFAMIVFSNSEEIMIGEKKFQKGPFIIKFNSNGEVLWGFSNYPGSWFGGLPQPRIVFDNQNNLIIGYGKWFGGSDLKIIDTQGVERYKYNFNNSNGDSPGYAHHLTALAIDRDDNLYVGIYFEENIKIFDEKYNGRNNIIITKLDKKQKLIWAKNIGSLGAEKIYALEIINNELYVSGHINRGIEPYPVDFGGKEIQRLTHSDGFIAKYKLDGELIDVQNLDNNFSHDQWGNMYKDGDVLYLRWASYLHTITDFNKISLKLSNLASFTLSRCGDKYITGTYTDTKTFSNGFELNSVGGKDVFVAKLKRTNPYPLVSPQQRQPENSSDYQELIARLTWHSVPCAFSYRIQIAKDPNFSNIVQDKRDLYDLSILTDSLEYLTEYYWRVRAYNSDTSSNWSSVWSFKTMNPEPEDAILEYPENQSINIEKQLTFRWKETAKATRYFLQVAKDMEFTDRIISNTNVSNNYFHATLETNTEYFWRVRAGNDFGASEWSEIWRFKTQPEKPEIPLLLRPVNNSDNEPLNTVFEWENMGEGILYNIIISQDIDFIFVDFDLETDDTLWRGMLDRNAEYYWKVRAFNTFESSDWSEVWTFKTGTQVGVKELELISNFAIRYYDNNLEIESKREANATIYNSIGQQISGESILIINGNNKIYLGDISKGTYFIKIQLDSKTTETFKFVIL